MEIPSFMSATISSIVKVSSQCRATTKNNKRRITRTRFAPVVAMTVAVILFHLPWAVQAFAPPPSCLSKQQSRTVSPSFFSSWEHQQQQQQKQQSESSSSSSSSPFRLSVAYTPNVLRHGGGAGGGEMDDPWSPSSELDDYEMDWRTFIGSYEAAATEEPNSNSKAAITKAPGLTASGKLSLGLTAAGVGVMLGAMLRFSGGGAWRYYLAGGVCAAFSHAIPVPIDVVKTRKQVDPAYCDLTMPVALRKLVATEGWSSLLVGLGPTFWGYFVEGAVKFGVYEILKPWLGLLVTNQWLNFVACAAVSGCAAAVMLCPMEALRIRLVAEPAYAAQGWLKGGVRMVQREGISGMTRGLMPMLYKQVPYTITKNVSFDFLTKLMYQLGAGTFTGASVLIPLGSAAMTSVLSCLSSQPGDMLLSLVNAHEGERRRMRDLIRQIMHSDRGLRGFMVGIKTRFLHVGMIVTVQLLIYDFVKRLFGIAATGSV